MNCIVSLIIKFIINFDFINIFCIFAKNYNMSDERQSAAKPLSSIEYEEGSQTITKVSTPVSNQVEKGDTRTHNGEGEDIVEFRLRNFIEKSKLKFGDNYNYDRVVYVNAKTKVKIICNKHNVTFEQTPDKHLNSKGGCPKCLKEIKKPYVRLQSKPCKSFEFYNKKITDKFHQSVEYISGKGRNSSIKITCIEHGDTVDTLNNLLLSGRKYICKKCSIKNRRVNKVHKPNSIIEKLNSIHPTLNIVFGDEYLNKKSKVIVTCPQHGSFKKEVNKLLAGQGCFKCTIDTLIKEGKLIGGYSEKLFKQNPEYKKLNGYIYLLKIGELFKIGITRVSVDSRIKSLQNLSKKDVILIHYFEMPLYKAFQIEQELLNEFNQYRVYRNYSSELFSIDITNKFLSKV